MNATLTAIAGLRVGHWTDHEAATGCSAILGPDEGMVASASFLGPSPGTREAILLMPEKKVPRIHGLFFGGGSAFGLGAADGVVRYLEERGIGHPTPAAKVPLVPAAIIYDLHVGDSRVRPGPEQGYQAASVASEDPVRCGRVGAGTGATAGKYITPLPAGLGSSLVRYGTAKVGALAVVNPVGDVTRPNGELLVGHGDREAFLNASLGFGSTTLLAIGIEAPVDKAQCARLAIAAQTALARVIRPSHTEWDGDSAFVLSTGLGAEAPMPLLSAMVQEAVERAVVHAVESSPA